MKLNQVLAIESSVRAKNMARFDALHHASDHPELFSGFHNVFAPTPGNDTEVMPEENKKVQGRVSEVLKEVTALLAEVFDIIATKDAGNTEARAAVELDGAVIFDELPATTLLFLEKQLATQILPFVEKLPELPEAEKWTYDKDSDLHKALPNRTHKTKKKTVPIMLVPPTDKHPGQAQLITEDIVIGFWDKELFSGGISRPDKQAILDRIAKLRRAITVAREQANMQDVEMKLVGQKLLNFVFKGVR
jgi:hypothetical protein